MATGTTIVARRTQCTAALFHAAGLPLELVELPMPSPAAGEAVVRIACCTICGSDVHTFTGRRSEPAPSILGHEVIGVVSDLGDPPLRDMDGRPLEVGDRVTWSICVSCGVCDRCRQRVPQKCRTLTKYGHGIAQGRYALSGGLAEFILLRPGSTVVRIANDLPDEVLCPANCATATVAAALRSAGPVAGRRVLILGAGLLGLSAAAMAKCHDASQVTVCDANPARLARAARFGADHSVEWHPEFDELRRHLSIDTGHSQFDVVLELSGSPDAVEAACHLGDVGARVILVGSVMESRSVRLNPAQIVRQWLCIQGVHNYAPADLRAAVDFLKTANSAYPFAELVEATYSLQHANEAMEAAARHHPVRVAVRP